MQTDSEKPPWFPEGDGGFFSAELLKQCVAPAWKDCPVGTVAYSYTGAYWTKQDDGQWRANGGDAFPTPGADASLVIRFNKPT
jgi:hypothetical protein